MPEPQRRQDTKEQQPKSAAEPARQLLFISHANPQDNAAASWFATQLTLMGYEVWCDLKNTHGGESEFWLKVQKKIENEAAKFIFILSDASRDFEKKRGVYKEVQAADNTRRENFIIPLRVEKLTGSVPIIIGPGIYIDSENWADGLRELHKRLVEDKVPRATAPDMQQIRSWWPALQAREKLLSTEPSDLVSNIAPLKALPEWIHLLKITADGNLLSGYELLRQVLPAHPAHSAQGQYAVSFARASDYAPLASGYSIADAAAIRTEEFFEKGCDDAGIPAKTAQNVVTYLVASAMENMLAARGLNQKEVRASRRRIWFPVYGLVQGNKHSITEPGKRKAPAWFVGSVSYRKKKYIWHFGVQPAVDLHTHKGVVFSPKAILSGPYRSDHGEKPFPIDHKKALKQLGWWNREWRTKTLAFLAWLANDDEVIHIPAGYQEILLASQPEIFDSDLTYLEEDDDSLIKDILGWTDA
jgi:hypothetical protein